MSQLLTTHDVAEIIKALQDYGVAIEFNTNTNEIEIPALVTYVNVDHGDLKMIQGDLELEYSHYSRHLWIYNEKKGEPLEIRFPRKSHVGFNNGYFWVIVH